MCPFCGGNPKTRDGKRSLSHFHFHHIRKEFVLCCHRQHQIAFFTMLSRKSFLVALFVLASVTLVSADESFIDSTIRKLKEVFSGGAAKVGEAADKATSVAEGLKKSAESVEEEVKHDVQERVNDAKKAAEDAQEAAKDEKAREKQESVQEQAAETAQEQVQSKIEEAQETVQEETDEAKNDL
jgi:hypothetical protein